MAKRSPLPWRVYKYTNVMSAEEYPYGLVAECDMGITGEEDKPALWEANATFIVRACNAHEELVAALEWMAESLCADADVLATARDRARAALAKARGEP